MEDWKARNLANVRNLPPTQDHRTPQKTIVILVALIAPIWIRCLNFGVVLHFQIQVVSDDENFEVVGGLGGFTSSEEEDWSPVLTVEGADSLVTSSRKMHQR